MMTSPRTTEYNSQLLFQQQQQQQQLQQQQQYAQLPPYTTNSTTINNNNTFQVIPHHNSIYNPTYTNYTTNTTAASQSNSSSFSLPSVPGPLYYDQQHIQPLPPQQVQPQDNDDKFPSRHVFYYSQPFGNPIISANTHVDYPYDPNQQFQPPPPPLLQHSSVPNLGLHGATTTTTSNLASTSFYPNTGTLPSTSSIEDVPFPGILETSVLPSSNQAQYRSNSHTGFTHHPHQQPRSQTFPNLENTKPSKRLSNPSINTGSSAGGATLLGMTPETARRNRCNICQKQFKRPSSLQTHLYSHTGEKPFACTWDNCGRLFSVRSNMIRHRKLHERDSKLKNDRDSHSSNSDEMDGELNDDEELGAQSDDLKDGQNNGHDVVDKSNVKHNLLQSSGNINSNSTTVASEFQLSW